MRHTKEFRGEIYEEFMLHNEVKAISQILGVNFSYLLNNELLEDFKENLEELAESVLAEYQVYSGLI